MGNGRAVPVWPRPAGRPFVRHWWSIQQPPPVGQIGARRAYGEVLLVWALFFAASVLAGAETLSGRYPAPSGSWAVFTPAAIGEIASAVLALLVVILLSARRGVTSRYLGFGVPPRPDGKAAFVQTFRIGVWAIGALVVGTVITGALATGHLNQPTHQNGAYLLYATAASISAGVVEESVVLAFLVTTLRQAARPLPEIVLVAVLLRCSYHDYYGPGMVGIAVWAAAYVWLYLRAGSVLVLIVVHFLWDFSIFLGEQWHAAVVGRNVLFLLLPIGAVISWLIEVTHRSSAPPGPPAPPGWHGHPIPPGGQGQSADWYG